jgi:hypothetical protein
MTWMAELVLPGNIFQVMEQILNVLNWFHDRVVALFPHSSSTAIVVAPPTDVMVASSTVSFSDQEVTLVTR